MDRGNGGQAIVDELAHEVQHLELMEDVEVGRRLVQKQDARLLGERARYEHSLALSSGQGVQRPVGESLGVGLTHRVAGYAVVLAALYLEAPEVRVPAHQHELE